MISKSGYVNFWKCPKLFWLHLYKPELEEEKSDFSKFIMSEGNRVGELARSYFPDTHNAEVKGPDGKIIYGDQIKKTKGFLDKNVNCIAEASFKYDELFCAVDLLKKDDNGGYSIYEVKCSSNLKDKEYYCVDAIFQRYVLEKCGLKINNVYILHANSKYAKNGNIELNKYFIAENVCDLHEGKWAKNAIKDLDSKIKNAISLFYEKNEPKVPFCKSCCDNKDRCSFYKYCHKDLPSNCVSKIYNIKLKAEDAYNKGIFTIDDYLKTNPNFKLERQKVQIEAYLNNKDKVINVAKLKEFLDKLKFPIFHLDFETTMSAIPDFDSLSPWESYPFQYSVHIQNKDGTVTKKSFLGEKLNCRRELAERLVKDIPMNSCVLAYHVSTERNIINDLASLYPDLSEHLFNISNSLIDLIEPFKEGYYYDSKQENINSIKEVLPSLCPHMVDAYKKLPDVHNGCETLALYRKLINEYKGKNDSLYESTRKGMLAYCDLDTLAMVEILKVLFDAVK